MTQYEKIIFFYFNPTDFGDFKTIFSKTYANETEEKLRSQIFKENLAFVNDHNDLFKQRKETFSLAINHFGDWTYAEYLQILGINPLQIRKPSPPEQRKKRAAECKAKEKDWRKEGAVTPVKDQKTCASCWAFSAAGALESHHFIKNKVLSNFSEQQFVDCSVDKGSGCNKGLMSKAFMYSMKNGLTTDDKYPYKGSENGENRTCNKFDSQLKISSFKEIAKGKEDELMDAICKYGPVSAAINAASRKFMLYGIGLYMNPECTSTIVNHGVLVVGYGYDKFADGDYWLVKNSYGDSWGDAGYFRIPRNFNNYCGIANLASYPVF